MSNLKAQSNNNGDAQPVNTGSGQLRDFQYPVCFEAYHIITFLQELHELEHAMLLMIPDSEI